MKRIVLLSFTLAFTGAVAPGPMLALVIGQTLAQGGVATLFILAGHAIVEAALVLLLANGFARLLKARWVSGILSLSGGLVLLWMGRGMLGVARQATLAAGDGAAAYPWYALVVAGIGVSLSNPYFTGWWATVGTGQIAALRLSRGRDYIVFLAGHEMGDMVWYLFVTVVLVAGRVWLSDRIYQFLLTACALVVLLLGGFFLFVGIRSLLRLRGIKPSADGAASSAPDAGRN